MVAMLWVRMRRPVRENRAGCVDDISPFHSTRPGRKKSDLMSLSNPRIHAALLQQRAQEHVLHHYSTNLTHAALPVQLLWDRSSVRRRMSTGPRASRRSRSRRCRSVCWSVSVRECCPTRVLVCLSAVAILGFTGLGMTAALTKRPCMHVVQTCVHWFVCAQQIEAGAETVTVRCSGASSRSTASFNAVGDLPNGPPERCLCSCSLDTLRP